MVVLGLTGPFLLQDGSHHPLLQGTNYVQRIGQTAPSANASQPGPFIFFLMRNPEHADVN
jgi:hypothetical protein